MLLSHNYSFQKHHYLKMKKILLLLAVVLMTATTMTAQPPRGGRMVQDRIEQLDKALTLTDKQKTQISEILKEGMSQMKMERPQMKNGEKPDEAAMKSLREQMEANHAAIDAKIAEVLTPEQVKKYEQLKSEEAKNKGARHHGPRDRGRMGHHPKGAPQQGCCDKAPNEAGSCDKAGTEQDCCKKAGNEPEKKDKE